MTSTAGPGRPRRWPARLAWALWLASLLCLAAVPWLDELLRQAGRPDLAQFVFPDVAIELGAIPAEGTLLVLERLLGRDGDPAAGFSDLNMLVMPGGQERTLDEYAALLAAAGFRLVGATPTSAGLSVIEGAPD